jgi:hypothetical protein
LIIKPCYHCGELGLRLFLLCVAEVAQCAEKTRRRTSSTYSVCTRPASGVNPEYWVRRAEIGSRTRLVQHWPHYHATITPGPLPTSITL